MATALEIDGEWDLGRDVSLQLGRWGRLDVQLLVEEHERGSVLVRIARRLRLRPFFAVSIGALAALVVLMASVPDGWVFATPAVIVAALMARAAWAAAATVALADQVVARALHEAGAHPLGSPDADVLPIAPPPPQPASSAVRHAS